MVVRILILAVHFEVTGARYITAAFKRLGHDVRHTGAQARLRDVWGVDVPARYQWQPDVLPPDWKPDLIILADTLVTVSSVPESFRDVPVVVWTQDNHVRNVRQEGVAHYFLAHYHGQAQPVKHPDETWLPCATDGTLFTPSPIPYDQREYDVCCVGVMYPRRQVLIDRLRNEGFKVFAATGLVYEEYRNAYHNARMSLCVSAAGDVAQRIFETLGMGCVVLTDPLHDLIEEDTQGRLGISGFSVYWSDDELVTRVREFLTVERGVGASVAAVTPRLIRQDHTWDKRAQVVVDWYKQTYGKTDMQQGIPVTKPYLNLGCGKTHFPSERPAGHEAIDPLLYQYPLWVNIDKVEGVGADKVFDLFAYPWPLESNSFDGAILAHILEHIPHEIKIAAGADLESEPVKHLQSLQDGWYAFFSELYRVLTPNALAHIVSPYGWSDGGITDPSHTRYLTLNSFTHSMTPDISDGSTFKYNNGGINFVAAQRPLYRVTPMFSHITDETELQDAMMKYLNVVYDFYIQLRAIKP